MIVFIYHRIYSFIICCHWMINHYKKNTIRINDFSKQQIIRILVNKGSNWKIKK